MSTFSVPVVRIQNIQKHPNADSLSTVVVEGETVVFKTGDFNEGDKAVYVPVDAVVPTAVPGTEFLGERPKDRRIRAKRLRGVYSEGLLLPCSVLPKWAPPGQPVADLGVDVASHLGIVKYEDELPESMGGLKGGSVKSGGQMESPLPGVPVYDIEAYKKYRGLLQDGERVIVTEKIHGTNSRFVYSRDNQKFYVGSRNNFWKNPWRQPTLREKLANMVFHMTGHRFGKKWVTVKPNLYWLTARQYNLEQKLVEYADYVFYGEIYGQVQDLKYGAKEGETWLRIFDIFDTVTGTWLEWDELCEICEDIGLDTVPVLYDGPFSHEAVEALVEGKSVVPDSLQEGCIREGVVVKPADSREDHRFGRVILKWVSQAYKLRKGGTELH